MKFRRIMQLCSHFHRGRGSILTQIYLTPKADYFHYTRWDGLWIDNIGEFWWQKKRKQKVVRVKEKIRRRKGYSRKATLSSYHALPKLGPRIVTFNTKYDRWRTILPHSKFFTLKIASNPFTRKKNNYRSISVVVNSLKFSGNNLNINQ